MTIYNSYNVEEKDETYILRDTAFNYGVAVNDAIKQIHFPMYQN